MNRKLFIVCCSLLVLMLLLAAPAAAEGPDEVSVSGGPPPGEPSPPSVGPGLFVTTIDNEDNTLTGNPDYDMGTDVWVPICNANPIHPIEFNIENDVDPVSAALLSILSYDVDTDYAPDPELDGVYFEGHYLGDLSGSSDHWSVNSFAVDPAWMKTGDNLVQIQVERNHPGRDRWCTYVRWGALEVEETPGEQFVPEPGAFTLLGSGLVALSGYATLRWRSRHKR